MHDVSFGNGVQAWINLTSCFYFSGSPAIFVAGCYLSSFSLSSAQILKVELHEMFTVLQWHISTQCPPKADPQMSSWKLAGLPSLQTCSPGTVFLVQCLVQCIKHMCIFLSNYIANLCGQDPNQYYSPLCLRTEHQRCSWTLIFLLLMIKWKGLRKEIES